MHQAMISAFECGWGVAVLVGVPSRDDAFKTSPVNCLNERTLKGARPGETGEVCSSLCAFLIDQQSI
ncbi:hypothetical protein SLEP1_g39791 [Rubroshorea leprosula]|uniref:Uncharacterized protein n=1 Tax=Rubroshorea leprosula TaxID=152421 RepID=A0AAV5L1D2_9ROSI|nr:hypothetical protein SLEP1_g39791 [Rubroshorea leprosula]